MGSDSDLVQTANKQERLIKSLTEEKLKAQERRSSFNIRKLIYVGGLFSLCVIKNPYDIDFKLVLFIVPFISICFDLYILGEDYGIKRIGGYIRNNFTTEPESNWEDWVGNHRDPFATYAVPLLSLIVLIASASILIQTYKNIFLFSVWMVLNIIAIIFNLIYSQRLRKKLLVNDERTK